MTEPLRWYRSDLDVFRGRMPDGTVRDLSPEEVEREFGGLSTLPLTGWKAQHRVLQRALSELEGTEYVEPQPRWVWFAAIPQAPTRVPCPNCPGTFRNSGSLGTHLRHFHGGTQ